MSLIPFTSIKTILPGTLAEFNENITDATLIDGSVLNAHIADSTDPHGSTLIQSVSVRSPIFQNPSGDVALAGTNVNIVGQNPSGDATVAILNIVGGQVANLTVDGTVNGRDVAADGTKLDNLAHETHYTLLAVGSGVSF